MEESQHHSNVPESVDFVPSIKLPGVIDLVKRAWGIYKMRFRRFLLLVLLPFFVGGGAAFLTGFFSLFGEGVGAFSFVLIAPLIAVVWIAAVLFNMWAQVTLLVAVRDYEERLGISVLFARSKQFIFAYIWIAILSFCIVMGGLLLFIIPGIILSVWFVFASYVLVAENRRGMSALLRSRELVRGNWWAVVWRLFALLLLFLPIVLLVFFLILAVFGGYEEEGTSGLVFDIIVNTISVIITPLFVVYVYLLYQDLLRFQGNPVFEEPSSGRKWKYRAFGILGVLFIVLMLMVAGFTALFGGEDSGDGGNEIENQWEFSLQRKETQ